MAVVALVVSVLWLGGVGSLVGAILGNVAARECKRTGQPGAGIATAAVIVAALGAVLCLFVYIA